MIRHDDFRQYDLIVIAKSKGVLICCTVLLLQRADRSGKAVRKSSDTLTGCAVRYHTVPYRYCADTYSTAHLKFRKF
jgi:hypothetical protein